MSSNTQSRSGQRSLLRRLPKISMSAPLVIGLTAASALVLLLDTRCQVAHSSVAHFAGNFILILAIGSLVEEKYGSRRLAVMLLLVTALVIGLITTLFGNVLIFRFARSKGILRASA